MRWPIRNQILLPLTALQVAVVVVVTAWAAWTGAARVRHDADRRAADVRQLLQRTSFPLTEAVLSQLRLLSGAEYVVYDESGRPAFTTLPDIDRALHALPAVRQLLVQGADADSRSLGAHYRAELIDARRTSGPPVRVLVLFPHDQLRALERDAVAGPLLTGGWILALTMLATTWVSHRIGARLQRIERQAARIAAGDFAPVPLPARDDEIRDLSQSVNRMADSLQQLTVSIRESERSRLIAQVVAGIAHQLRNALTGIRMAIQVHQRRCPVRQDGSLDVALRQLSLTEQQIRGLLGLTRGEQGTVIAGPVSVLLDEIAAMIEPVCEHRRIEFTFRAECDPHAVVTDADAFRSAVLNLCMNAVEAAGRPGTLAVVARQRDDTLEVAVSDNGPGVPEAVRRSLFTPFVTTKPEGVGLGLALAQSAAQALGGNVELARINDRTVFTFRCSVRPSQTLAS